MAAQTFRRACALLIAGALMATSCGGSSGDESDRIAELERQVESLQSESDQSTTASPSTTRQASVTATSAVPATSPPIAADIEPPGISVEWFGKSEEFEFFRFLAWITNPNDVPLTGVVVHWEAIDGAGVILGSHERRFPVIDPGFAFPYVGGAGGLNLSGTPATVKVFLDTPGHPAPASTASPFFSVLETDLGGPDEFGSFKPSAVAQAPADRSVSGFRTQSVWIFRDEAGSVVGAEFDNWTPLPDTINAGAKVKVETSMSSDTFDGGFNPTNLEVFVYEDVP